MIKKNLLLLMLAFCINIFSVNAQQSADAKTDLAPTPPMGWMTWNYFGTDINENIIREIADAMVANGMVKAGYDHIMIDDGWQGGRIPTQLKFVIKKWLML
jgi:alpha-galactosidase